MLIQNDGWSRHLISCNFIKIWCGHFMLINHHFHQKVTFNRKYTKHWGNHGKAFFGHFNWRISLRKSTLGTFEKNFGKIGQS